MKSKLTLLLAFLLLITNALWITNQILSSKSQERHDRAWQEASQPVFAARGISGENTNPSLLADALDATHAFNRDESYKNDVGWRRANRTRLIIAPTSHEWVRIK